ncbi:MAG: sensor histidine kinase, partial [Rhodospirillales bacterium]|nr:sensor histidine kinase [Rhodospirillales bacterium]
MTAEVPLSAPVRPRLRRLMRSLVFRLAVLAAAFIVVPVVLYGEFRAADASRRAILLESIREKGAVIGRALSPVLARADAVPYARLNEELSRYSTGSVALKLLFRPAASADPLGFFYVASTPPVAPAGLNIERRRLIDTGILDRVGKSCEGNIPLALRVELPEGRTELLTSVAPVRTSGGCWALVVSSALDEIGDVALGLPYWRSPEVQIAAAAYLVLAVIVLGIFFDLWRSLLRFGRTARAVRAGADDGRFAERNTVPELAEVAVDFDRMVETLRRSAINIRRAAEDSAHAFKTPLGIIRQSLEPLRRAEGDPSVGRSARSIDAAVDRLAGPVAAARRLDRTTADLLDQPREPVDLGTLVRGLVAGYGEA